MALKRRIGRRRLVDPGVVLYNINNLLFEIECLSSSVELRDIRNYILHLEAMTTNLRRLSSSHAALTPSMIDQITDGLDKLKTLFEDKELQTVNQRGGYTAPRVHTGKLLSAVAYMAF